MTERVIQSSQSNPEAAEGGLFGVWLGIVIFALFLILVIGGPFVLIGCK
jgi:hypothetical protein